MAQKAQKIRLTVDEMRYIALFESITSASVHDCIIDDKWNRILMIVNPGQIGMAIGKEGSNIRLLRGMFKRDIEIVEYSENPLDLIKNSFSPVKIKDIRISERLNKKKIAMVEVEMKDKGAAIGKEGRKAERTRVLAKRYFQIDNVVIT